MGHRRLDRRDGARQVLGHVLVGLRPAAAERLIEAHDRLRMGKLGLRERSFGRFVLISGAISARPLPGCAAYGTVKAGLHCFQRHLALEEGRHGVTANTIAPGRVARQAEATTSAAWEEANTSGPMKPVLSTDPRPEEVAVLATYFCSPAAHGVTGQVVYMARGEVMP